MKTLVLIAFSAYFLTNCATFSERVAPVRKNYQAKKYPEALEALDQSDLKSDSNNLILYQLEKAMILDRIGQTKDSREWFFKADRTGDKLYTKSITKSIATFLVNDEQIDYNGEFYELINIHTLLALSFIEDQNLKSARIEASKINLKLIELYKNFKLKESKYKQDAFARYLSGTIYEARREYDSAIIDYQKALDLYAHSKYKKFYDGPVPPHLVKALYNLAKKRNRNLILKKLKKDYPQVIKEYSSKNDSTELAQVCVIHEIGSIQHKIQKDFHIEINSIFLRLSFPYIPLQKFHNRGTTGVQWNNKFIKGYSVANMNNIAHTVLEEKRSWLLSKNLMRNTLKALAVSKIKDEYGSLAGAIANGFTYATETADTRSWTSLPESFYMTRFFVKPGKHQLKFKNQGHFDKSINFEAKPNQVYIFRDK